MDDVLGKKTVKSIYLDVRVNYAKSNTNKILGNIVKTRAIKTDRLHNWPMSDVTSRGEATNHSRALQTDILEKVNNWD